MVLTDTGIDNLRCAIVQQAAFDYLDYKKRLYKLKDSDTSYAYQVRKFATGRLAEFKKWFESDYYALLCGIDGNKMLRRLDDEYEKWRRRYDAIYQETDTKEKRKKQKSLWHSNYKKKRVILA